MAGIYVHIPFCKQACHYCDFHFSTNQSQKSAMVDAIVSELKSKKLYLHNVIINTIYFGGGTPSVLRAEDIEKIQSTIYANFEVSGNVEVTFECNPDDLNEDYLKILKFNGINRLSIGVQSFDQLQLSDLNRAHTAKEAEKCIRIAKKMGFENITIDLMYGLPNTDLTYWKQQVETALMLEVSHISAYCLTYEEKTVFGNWLKKGKINPLSDDHNLAQFQLLINLLQSKGYEHYEISNFAKPGAISKHNSAYWLGEKYLGIGPSAHSFNGVSRHWNIANNAQYIKKVSQNEVVFEEEILSEENKFNEYILTRIRTKWGLEKDFLAHHYPKFFKKMLQKISRFTEASEILETDTHFFLTEKGKFIADYITSELIVI